MKLDYKNKNVFITGITGFKGAWLALLLHKLGANVSGLGLKQPEQETIFYDGEVSKIAKVYEVDILSEFNGFLENTIKNSDYVFHLAAQPIVIDGYKDPYYTFNVNTMGTLKMLELLKNTEKEVTFINVASDRVYGSISSEHTEDSILEGHEPYSLSKVFSNMLADLYNEMDGVSKNLKVINVRASNILGGGDKGAYRILTSLEEAKKTGTLMLRNPSFVRPYLYVLDCLFQYLIIAQNGTQKAYNIGAGKENSVSVKTLVNSYKRYYNHITVEQEKEKFGFEGQTLLVNTDRFNSEFKEITPIASNIDKIVDKIIEYNSSDYKKETANKLIEEAITHYIR